MSKPNRLLTLNFILAAIEGLGVTWLFAAKPAGDQGASIQRILLVAAAVAGVAFFGFLAVRSWMKPAPTEAFFVSLARDRRKRPLLALICLVFALGWMGTFVPSDRLNAVIAIYERIRPAVLWVTLAAGQVLIILLIRSEWKNERPLLKMTGVVLGIFLLVWAFMALTRVGVTPDDRYWNEAGAPLLWLQILLAWIASVGIGLLLSWRGQAPRKAAYFVPGWVKDVLICILLFASAAILWSQTPVARSYFSPGPFPPNNVFYPFSDSQVYDTGAQFVFIGQGLNNNELSDKPFYVLLLTVLHLIVGQDYSKVVQLQAVFLAFFAVLLYFIGKLIHSRAAGILAGILGVLWETNSIASTLQIQVSHARLELTEFPTACGLALAAVVLILWLKKPHPASLKLALAGGIMGAVALTRPNSLLVVLLVFVLIAAVFGRRWRSTLPAAGLFTLGLALVVGPWYLVNKTPTGSSFLEEKFRAVIEQRYQGNFVPTPMPVHPGATATPAPTPTPLPTPQKQTTPSVQATPLPEGGAAAVSPMSSPFQFVPAHFFHNLDMSVLILPISFGSSDLAAVLKAPYWKVDNILEFTPAEAIFFFFNLLVLAVGLAAAWKIGRLGGLFPLAVFLVYNLANALARNSGGRYLVPVNWIVFVYFALGLVQLGLWATALLGARLETTAPVAAVVPAAAASVRPPHWLRNAAILAAGLLLVGTSLLLVGSFFPRRYAAQTSQQLLQTALSRGSLQTAGVTPQQAMSLVNENGGLIIRGRGLYPDYMNYKPDAAAPDLTFSFRVIGPVSAPIFMPLNKLLPSFPDAADVTVLGCLNGVYLWAQAVIVENPAGADTVLLSSPAPTWKCP